MAEEKKGPPAEKQTQSSEARSATLNASATATTPSSATGQAKENDSGKEDERLEGRDEQQEPQNAPTKGDFAQVKTEAPKGLQAEPANFTTSGTIPAGFVSSPTGFVPLSAVSDPEAALERTLAANGRNRDERKLSEEEVEAISGVELRAIGVQRGYELPDFAGQHTMRRRFLREQEKDESLTEKSEKRSLTARLVGR